MAAQGNPFENVKPQIGHCGLWCGSCIVGNGALRALTERYEHLIKGYGVAEWGAQEFDGPEFLKGLASIRALPVCHGCRNGDGNDECAIRPCASKRNVTDCPQCTARQTCPNRAALQNVRAGALRGGMKVTTGEETATRRQLIEQWTAEMRRKFPGCILDACRGRKAVS